VTPATVQISVNPTAFQNQTGTTAIPLTITSQAAVNLPQHVRLLVSNPGPDQRGTIIDVPGTLSDMLADPVRNLVYLLRQDKNELLVYMDTYVFGKGYLGTTAQKVPEKYYHIKK